jgi:23S rRNA (uridine2552-2'-O)-methyltransferase
MSGNYNRKDHLYKQAKESGYRSRASFKLLEIQKKYKILRPAQAVLDLGCFPGGWLQVAAETCGKKSCVIGIDLKEVEALSGNNAVVHILKGDLATEDIKMQIRGLHSPPFDVILSDMSPALSGIKDRDQVAAAELFELALVYCDKFLTPGGSFIAKIFPGKETEDVFRNAKQKWKSLLRKNLDSTRSSSNEMYVIGTGFKG